uniref:Imidazole glycerol phosphate synthase cyclase subunit n=1 Tax=uncultured bacterium contig00069 TaxID=1181550 RepID=A0A806KDN6_9BACT|nr:imidazole glycerol phosphate synthase cyclase subunit [uncultured bacterium contig00069]
MSINSLAVLAPNIIAEGAKAFGNQCIVLGMDALSVGVSEKIPSGYEVVIRGGRQRTGLDAVEWAKKAVDLGAGEICLNSIDTDGVRNGYELKNHRKNLASRSRSGNCERRRRRAKAHCGIV